MAFDIYTKCTVYFYHFETSSTPRLSGFHGVLREHVGIIRHWPFCRSTATGNCRLWYGNRKWRLDGTNCNLSLSFYLSIFSLYFFHPPSTIPFYPFFISFFLSSFLTFFDFAIIRFSVYNVWLLHLNFSFYYLFLICNHCRFLEQKTDKSKVYIANLRGLLLKNLNFIE